MELRWAAKRATAPDPGSTFAASTIRKQNFHCSELIARSHVTNVTKRSAGSHEIQFKGTPKNCEACHTDPHGGQFVAKDGITKCGDCHVDQRWAPSTFDHDKRTQFPLTGAHANVGCAMCHTLQREVQGKPVLFYKPTPKNCADCHGADVRPL